MFFQKGEMHKSWFKEEPLQGSTDIPKDLRAEKTASLIANWDRKWSVPEEQENGLRGNEGTGCHTRGRGNRTGLRVSGTLPVPGKVHLSQA